MKQCPHCKQSLLVNCGKCACGCGETVWAHPSTANRTKNKARFASKKCANRWYSQVVKEAWEAYWLKAQEQQREKVARGAK